MEYTDNQTKVNKWIKTNRETINLLINVSFVLAIFIFSFLLVFVIIKLVKNADEIRTDPIMYGMDKNEYAVCSCQDSHGERIDYRIGLPNWNKNLNEVVVIDGTG